MSTRGPNAAGTRYVDASGNVAVVIASEAGWSTLNPGDDSKLFDPGLVTLLLEGAPEDDIEDYIGNRWPGASVAGIDSLDVRWVRAGRTFVVSQDCGQEQIEFGDQMAWVVP